MASLRAPQRIPKPLRFNALLILVVCACLAAHDKSHAAPASRAAPPLTPVTLQLLWHHQFQFAGYYAALEQGYYRQAGLDVEIRSGGYDASGHAPNPVDEVVQGRADFGISRSDLLISHSQGQPVTLVANIMQRSPLTFLTLERYGFTRLEEIGKRPVSLTLPTLTTDNRISVETLAALQRAGVDYRTLNNSAPSWELQDLISGKTQLMTAYSTDAPYFVRQRGEVPVEIHPADYGIDLYGELLFTHQRLVDEEPEMVAAFRDASLKGWQYAMDNREEVAKLILAKYETRGPQIDIDLLLYEAGRIAELMQPGLIEIGYTNRERWEAIADLYQEQGLISHRDIDDFLRAAVVVDSHLTQSTLWLYSGALGATLFMIAIGYLYVANRHLSTEVVKHKDTERTLRQQAEKDGLTGIDNRRSFEETYQREVTRAQRYKSALSLIIFDVDHFKQVNDTFGHLAGDQVLIEITRITKQQLRSSDTFARYGGEEFAILLPCTSLDEACQIAKRILEVNRQHVVSTESHSIHYTLSIGLAELVEADATPNDLLRRADRLLYQAKRTGRDVLCC